jgi:hypothetical protein
MLVVHRNPQPQKRTVRTRDKVFVEVDVTRKPPRNTGRQAPRRNAVNNPPPTPPVNQVPQSPPPPYSSPVARQQPVQARPPPRPQPVQSRPPPQTQPIQHRPPPQPIQQLPLPLPFNHGPPLPQPASYGYQPPPERSLLNVLRNNQTVNDLPDIVSRPLQMTLNGFEQWAEWGNEYRYRPQGTGLGDLIASKFDSVITSIDGESFSGDERELIIYPAPDPAIRGGGAWGSREISRKVNNAATSAVTGPRGTNYFAKANLYANSKLPPGMPDLKLYMPSYPLICLAAQFSQKAYVRPTGQEKEAHVEADWRLGTKAMVLKSIPIDDMEAVVFAIRGSQTFMDWAVNLNSAPSAPTNFLDDEGNMCHSGFLAVARKMIRPVAARLRELLEHKPSRRNCSLIMTGHSAGGAVASLLYAHMMAESTRSELNILTSSFKRIHCITFGTPPVSLLPIGKSSNPRYKKSLFLSFINEGDPVPRADRAYVRSLLDLYTTPAPGSSCIASILPPLPLARPRWGFRRKSQDTNSAPPPPLPYWNVPPGSLSNAGRLVVLRASDAAYDEDVTAVVTTDELLRGVVFGNPVMHMMKVYARRIEVLATKAVTAKVWG